MDNQKHGAGVRGEDAQTQEYAAPTNTAGAGYPGDGSDDKEMDKMNKHRRMIDFTVTQDRDVFVMFSQGRKPSRFYHELSDASIVRLHRAVEALVQDGRWKATPYHYATQGGYHIGWQAKPATW